MKSKKYYRLDVSGGIDNYLKLMSQHKNVSIAKYIRSLINKDIEQNKNLYNKLLCVENERLSIKGE